MRRPRSGFLAMLAAVPMVVIGVTPLYHYLWQALAFVGVALYLLLALAFTAAAIRQVWRRLTR